MPLFGVVHMTTRNLCWNPKVDQSGHQGLGHSLQSTITESDAV